MEPLRVHVKWGKEKFDNVLVHLDQSPALFKAQLFELTGVQPERQKIVCAGKALGNDSWDGFSIKPGCQLLLLGTTGDLPGVPVNKTVFVEDMTPAEVIKAKDLLAGIKNLGNTCYMNATLQCLATVPELMEGFRKFLLSPSLQLGGNRFFMVILAEQFKAMLCRDPEFTTPVVLVECLCKSFPQFATKDEQGQHQQQDANELWVLLLRLSSELLPFAHKAEGSEETIVSAYLTGEFFITMHSAESGETETDTERFQQLSCFLTGEVKHLINGLRAKMTEGVTKRSATLERDVVFERKYAISRLPKYLTVQMVRFFYKEKDQVNAKILKDVKFPIELDVYDLCTDELKAKLQPARQMIDDIEEKKKSTLTQANNETSKPNDEGEILPTSFEDDVGSNNSGRYTLQAVLTHKGRSSNSGHYVAWVRGKREHQWLKCDDEVVSIVTEEEILRLSGGGDWHCAYVLLYGPKVRVMPFRDDLLNLCYRLRDEKLLVTSELEQILLLNNDVEEGTVGLVKACWIQSHQHETLSRLVQLHVDGSLQNCCAQLSYYENATFRDAVSVLPSHTATLTELLRLLLNNSRLVANILHLVDALEPPSSSDEACRIFFSGAFGCCQFVGDEKCLVEALSCLMRLQLVSNSQLDLRRTLRKGRGSFCKLYRLLIESLFSVKLFLTSALHAPVLRLISENELFLDFDPDRAAMRLSASEKLAYYGAEGSAQYKENVAKYRKTIIQQLVSSTQQFVQSIKASLHCFPPSLAWLLRQLHGMLRYAAKLPPSDCDLVCTELVFTYFLCPAIATPEAFGILSDTTIGNVARFNLIQIGQILQTLAVSQWDSTDPKLVELYGQFEADPVSSIVYSILYNSSANLTGLEDIYQLDGKLTRHLSAMTIEELDKLLNLVRRVCELSASPPPEVESVWSEMKQLVSSLPTRFCTSPQQTCSVDGESTHSRSRSYIKLPKTIGMSLMKSPSESDSSNSASADAPTVLLIPISSSPEPIGLLAEDKVLLMVRQEKYRREENMVCNAKRTRFLLNADAESMGASSDHFDEAVSDEQASMTSSVEQMTNADMSALNDNFSDVDVVPISANVSGRGSPSISGRDTPSSVPLDPNDNAYELSSQSTSGNSARPKVSSGSLVIPAIKEAAMEERFGKFGIPRPTRESHRDETHSMVSDSWSTDVLASDSEMGGETPSTIVINGSQSGLLPDLVPCQTPSMPRFDLVPIKATTSSKVPPSDQSSLCDRSDTWSVDAGASDSENEPGIRQDERLQEFENDVFPSVSGCQAPCSSVQPTSEEGDQPEATGAWERRKKPMQRQSSGSSFHSEVPDDGSLVGNENLVVAGSTWKDRNQATSSLSQLASSSFRSYLSPAFSSVTAASTTPVATEASTVSFHILDEREELSMTLQASSSRHRSANFAAAMARKLSPHVSRVISMKAPSFSLSPPYESPRDGLLKSLKFRALRGKVLPMRSTVSHQSPAVSAPIEDVDMDTGDQILEKYRAMRAVGNGSYDLIAPSGEPPIVKMSEATLAERSSSNDNPMPYFDGTNVTQCQAFGDAKRKLRLLLSSVDVDSLPVTLSRLSLSKELKESDELLQFLRTMLADTVVTEAKSLSVQLEDLMRLLSMFDAKGMRKLLKTMHDERCRRSAYAAYLQQSKLTLLQQRSLLQRMLGRVQREQRLAVRSVLELCVHLFLEQRCDSQLKAFVQQFQQLQTQDEKTDVLERFLRTIYCSAETEPMLQGCTPKQTSYIQGCIERLVLTRIYFSALYPNGDGDIMRDKLFHETVERLSATITPGHKNIAIPSIYHAECPWPSAQAELAIINVQKTPREKVNCVRRCCETVLQLLSISSSNVPSADDIMPVLVFVVIKTNPEALLSTIQYVNGFYGNRLRGEDAYWWAQFCSAVEFIKILADMDT